MTEITTQQPQPEITGALLSSMLTSMQDLGGLGQQLLSSYGVDEIVMDRWYPRELQHLCFNALHKRLGDRGLYAVGFAYQNLVIQRYSTELQTIEQKIKLFCEQNISTDEKVSAAVGAAAEILSVLNSGSKNNIRNHPEDYGFYCIRSADNSCLVSFHSFPVTAITPYCEAIIYCLLRMTLPPRIQIEIKASAAHPGRIHGFHHDTFELIFSWKDTDQSVTTMRALETLRVKESLMRSAVEAAENSEKKAALALAFHMDSVNYASRIQRGMLPPEERLTRQFRSHAVLWEPRDLIGGDIYWTSSSNTGETFSMALVDCTGHGVPGAMLSLLVASTLERIYQIDPAIAPGVALAQLGDMMRSLLRQDQQDAPSRDGLDAAICRINPATHQIEYAGARVSLYIVPGHSHRPVERISCEKRTLGYAGTTPHQNLPLHHLSSHPGDVFVLVSDGIIDQMGHEKRLTFGNKRLLQALGDCIGRTPAEVLEHLHSQLALWQGAEPRRDDISAFAFTI
jgi:serine phosphatase RsbU (regulator of sigma subunit)